MGKVKLIGEGVRWESIEKSMDFAKQSAVRPVRLHR